MSVENNLLLRGYALSDAPGAGLREANPKEILFVGHIYPQNGFRSLEKPNFPVTEAPLGFLEKMVKEAPPKRIVFGGDSIWDPSAEALEHIATVKAKFPMSRFVLGNHEKYWQKLRSQPDDMKAIYGEPFYYEDVDGVRLIYLHTVQEDLTYGLDRMQREFLNSTLDPSQYRYALIFMHHALWAGDMIYINKPYPDAEAVARVWIDEILPTLASRGVKGVFAGDGGWRARGRRFVIQGIPHYITGWSGYRTDLMPEWLSIEMETNSIQVDWNTLFRGEHYVYPEPATALRLDAVGTGTAALTRSP